MKAHKYTLIIGWLIWSIAAVFYGLDYFQHTAPSVLLKPISADTGVGIDQIANVMSIYFPIYALSQIPAGILLDRLGARVMMSVSCFVMSLGVLLFVYDPNISTMLIGRILIAIGSAVAFIGTLKVAADILPERLFPVAVGFTNTLGVLGGIFGQVFLHYLVNLNGWQSALAFIGYFGLVWSVVIIVLLKYPNVSAELKIKKTKISFMQGVKILCNKRLWMIAIYAGLMVGIVVNAFSELYDVLFLEHVYHLTSSEAAKISVMMFVGIAVGGPLHGLIARYFGEKHLWMLMCNIVTVFTFSGVILLSDSISYDFLYILFFIIGFTVSSMLLAFSIVEEMYPSEIKATALAIVNMVIGLSGAIFSYLISSISVYVNGGPLLEKINPGVFESSFIYLLAPLLLSTIMICILFIDRYSARLRS